MYNIFDYDQVIHSVASYLIRAKVFFGKYKNNFSIGLIPDGHHIYTGPLKALGYRLLKPNKNLILIGKVSVNKKIYVLNKKLDVFMGKSWDINKNTISILKKNKIVEFTNYKFDRIESEIPFFRLISDYDSILFIGIGDNLSKITLVNLLFELSKNSNLMFISDFNKDMPMEIFFRLAKKIGKSPTSLAYLDTGNIFANKDVTNGSGSIFL